MAYARCSDTCDVYVYKNFTPEDTFSLHISNNLDGAIISEFESWKLSPPELIERLQRLNELGAKVPSDLISKLSNTFPELLKKSNN